METRLRSLREDNDLTQKQLSKILNISQVAYSYYELSKRSIPLELCLNLPIIIIQVLIIFCIELMKPFLIPKNQ